MSPECRSASLLGPQPRRRAWTTGRALASLALVLAAGVVSPAMASGHPVGATGATRASGTFANVGASIFADSSQTIPTNIPTKINFTGADFDTDLMFDPMNSALVVHTAGRYLLEGRILWANLIPIPAEGANRELLINLNGNAIAGDAQNTVDPGGFELSQDVSTIVQLNVDDVISLSAFQTTGHDATSLHSSGGMSGKTLAPQLVAEWLAP
ncbi:hypothetical protein [Streptomyces sp. NPDC097640]|uniref:hypothetical protein n=1 Tax=Streptomyces sp. NPDC097640 TaxID=3157229 RepID=UPI003329DD20